MESPEAAVAILHTQGPEECVLLIRRAEREGDSWSGHWSFPGGRLDPGDPDLVHTALRELEEECGITLSRPDQQTDLPPMHARRAVGSYVLVAPFVFRVDRVLPTTPDPREAAEVLWIPVATLRDPSQHRLTHVPGRPREVLYPSIPLAGAPLWGFTYRVITAWLGLGVTGTPSLPDLLLERLLGEGLTLRRTWENRIAVVDGPIPVERILAALSEPGPHVPLINAVEVTPTHIHVIDLSLAEHEICVIS